MSTARFNTLQNAAGSKSVPVDTVVDGSAKAWVIFNGVGTVSITQAFNVSSITDNAVGDYTVNFATALASANYAATSSAGYGNNAASGEANTYIPYNATPTTTSVRMAVTSDAGGLRDAVYVSVAIFR